MAKIMIIDDEELLGSSVMQLLRKRGYDAHSFVNPVTALNVLQRERFDVVLTDFRMPNIDGLEMIERIREFRPHIKIILMTAYSSISHAVEAMKRGADEYITKPFEIEELEKRLEEIGTQARSRKKKANVAGYELLGNSLIMQKLGEQIRKVGRSGASVLVRGESGTGKELVARQIHFHSSRNTEVFLPVNMAAISQNLMESEFFGYRKGAFTGAEQDQIGKFQASHHGTIFLDEIAELPLAFQAKLLRVLQDFTFSPVGSSEVVKVDVRVISATNRDVLSMCSQGSFREDLFYRLNIIELVVPPLRERIEDIPVLCDHFLSKYSSHEEISMSEEFLSFLRAYNWPGNVRELENVIHRCVVLAEGDSLDIHDLPRQISGLTPRKETPLCDVAYRQLQEGKSLLDIEKEIILKAIDESLGNKSNAAKILKMTRRKLYSRLEKHGIEI